MEKGGASYYYHFDGLGSVTTLTSATGSTSETYTYDAFGKPSSVSTLGNRFMFTGREYDSETGLYYYRRRYYDPVIGRFLQRDAWPTPLTDPSSLVNKYVYCGNNPINFVDPFGLDKQKNQWWKWGAENWLWQYWYGGGELVDPRFWDIWKREFNSYRFPGAQTFSPFGIPWGLGVAAGSEVTFRYLTWSAQIRTFSQIETFSLGQSAIYMRGYAPHLLQWANVARGVGIASTLVTAFYAGTDIGTAVYSYWEAFRIYQEEH